MPRPIELLLCNYTLGYQRIKPLFRTFDCGHARYEGQVPSRHKKCIKQHWTGPCNRCIEEILSNDVAEILVQLGVKQPLLRADLDEAIKAVEDKAFALQDLRDVQSGGDCPECRVLLEKIDQDFWRILLRFYIRGNLMRKTNGRIEDGDHAQYMKSRLEEINLQNKPADGEQDRSPGRGQVFWVSSLKIAQVND